MHSYHDVVVYVGNTRYRVADNYALQLHCTRAAGWRLYKVWNDREELLGGEYDGEPFCVEVGAMIICGKKPEQITEPGPFGWDGWVHKPA